MKISSYLNPDGRDVTQDWYEKAHTDARMEFRSTLFSLRHKENWRKPDFKPLDNRNQCFGGIGELRFSDGVEDPNGVHYRALGFYIDAPKNEHFIVLLIDEKPKRGDDNEFYERNCPIAQDLKAEVIARGEELYHECPYFIS